MSRAALLTHTREPQGLEVETMFREHSRLVYRTAYSVTASPHDAEDVVQTLFLQLLRRGFPPDFAKNPTGYLYRAAVNLSLNAVKSRKRRASAADPARLQLAVDVAGEADRQNSEEDLR